ncbi:hypothetical protein [Patulibacter sp.]|uniref:hypothetical protein n=1 Tax=Patulibacter sp. TaxID=1912859 RepID=UPI002721E2F0|nr:hypothetical protein [Patulibacter sp.]MDO9408147.1 hypothetical protein [Patulibacter sp.]
MDGSFAFFLLICALFGIAGGLQGRSKGGSFLLWFFISACLPLFGFLASVVYPGRRHELRRRCDGCGRFLPITDTMCMGCGTDLDFPEVRYRSVGGTVVAVGPDGRPLEDPSGPGPDDGEDESPYERTENPYEHAADGPDAEGPVAPAAGVASPDR